VPGIDFFDVDHTITRRSSGGRFIILAIRRGVLPARFAFIVPWYAFTYRVGLFRLREYAEGFRSLTGRTRRELDAISRESFQRKLRSDVFDAAAALIREKIEAGRRVVLATSSLDFIVAPLAEHLGVADVVATRLEFRDGVCTGRIAGLPLLHREKQRRVLAFMAEAGHEPRECSFYSDSIYDLPLLQEIGNPVAVNPDFRLRRIARRKGWPVLYVS
jgi:HAD superfamily hydrolase (TIGR01490 family)